MKRRKDSFNHHPLAFGQGQQEPRDATHQPSAEGVNETPRKVFVLKTKCILSLLPIFLLIGGCGAVSQTPISPLYQPALVNSFEAGTNGWALDNFASPALQTQPSFSTAQFLDGTGSLKVPITFTKAGDKVPVFTNSLPTTDLRNKTLSIWVYWDQGLVDVSGTIQGTLYIDNNAGTFFLNSASANLQRQKWVQIVFNVNSPSYTQGVVDLTTVQKVGVQIYANTGNSFSSGVVYLDDFGY